MKSRLLRHGLPHRRQAVDAGHLPARRRRRRRARACRAAASTSSSSTAGRVGARRVQRHRRRRLQRVGQAAHRQRAPLRPRRGRHRHAVDPHPLGPRRRHGRAAHVPASGGRHAPAYYKDPIEPYYGAPQSVASHAHADRGDDVGLFYEAAPMHPMLAAVATAGFGTQHHDTMQRLPYLAAHIALAIDGFHPSEDGGTVSVRAVGRAARSTTSCRRACGRRCARG